MKTIEETLSAIKNNFAMNELRLKQYENDKDNYKDKISECYIKRNIFMQIIDFIEDK